MKIILIRHGTAYPVSKKFNEQNRPLTKDGGKEIIKIRDYLSKSCEKYEELWISPYKRAIQTAVNVCNVINKQEMKIMDILKPDANPKEVIKRIILSFSEIRVLYIVSHQPLLGKLLGEVFQTSSTSFEILPATIIELFLKERTDNSKNQLQFILVKFLHSQHIF